MLKDEVNIQVLNVDTRIKTYLNLFISIKRLKSLLHHWKNRVRTNFFLAVYTGNNQAHMKKMVRNEDTFTQRFRTAKGVQTRCFFGFGAIAAYGPKTKKSESKHGTEGLHGKSIWSVPPQFLWVWTHFCL